MIHDLPRTFVITVQKTWAKWEKTQAHLKERGIHHAEPFLGFDKFVWKFQPELLFELNAPGERLGWGPLAAYLSHYMIWKVMSYLPDETFWVLEDDAEFTDNWRHEYSEAMSVLPDDWDMVFIGSCCAESCHGGHIDKNLYEKHYPMCGHAIMYRKKCLSTLLEVHQRIWAPLDIAMKYDSLPKLRVYTILPRIVNQRDTGIPP